MELELKGTLLSGYTLAAETTLFSEETLESIVPDACPDILRILRTGAYVCVRSGETREGRAEVRGMVCAQVLYLPEGEGAIRHLEVAIPFSAHLDHTAVRAGAVLHTSARVMSADARMLNPRKVYVRAEIALDVACYLPEGRTIRSCCCGEPRLGIRERREESRFCFVKAVWSKPFSFSEDLTLPDGKPDLAELLSHRVRLSCTESRIIGSKLIFKGQAEFEILYRSTEETLENVCFALPFSQVTETPDGGEEMECTLDVTLTDLSCQTDGQSPRSLTLSMNLTAQAVLRQYRSVQLLCDLYSTAYALKSGTREETFCRLSTGERVRQELCQTLDTPMHVSAVIDAAASVGGVSQSWEGSNLLCTADVRVHLLCRGEDGTLFSLTRPLTAVYRLPAGEAYTYHVRCRCTGAVTALPAAEGAQVQAELEFLVRTEQWGRVCMVERAELDEETPWNGAERPSVILRAAGAGESLWDLAKSCLTTAVEIMEANELTEEEDLAGRMLLIPKKR